MRIGRKLRESVILLGLAGYLFTTVGCFEAPEIGGPDQVHDPNVAMTAAKDNEFEAMSWADVDAVMVDQLVSDPNNEPGCGLGIVRDGEILYLQGYGYANGANAQRWNAGTMGAVGSISKTLTAAALLKMVDDGHVDLTQPVSDFLVTSNVALGASGLESLLDHSSGIGGASQGAAFEPNWEPASDAFGCDTNPAAQPAGICPLTSRWLALPESAFGMYEANEAVTNFAIQPGLSAGVYSNVGMSVAGAVVDAVAKNELGLSGYEEYVWNELGQWSDNLFEGGQLYSLALTHSWRDADIPNRAVGYGTGPAWPVFEAWQDTGGIEGWEGPSGGWAMTTGDLARMMIALDESHYFDDPGLRDQMRMPQTDLAGFTDHYGLGTFLGPGTSFGADYWHGGDIGGHHAAWAWWDDYDGHEIGIGIMCNRDDFNSSNIYATMFWQSGETSEETLVWLAANQNPDPPSQIVYASVADEDIEGLEFVLMTEQAWLEGGRDVAIPFGLAELDLRLDVAESPTYAQSALTLKQVARSQLAASVRPADPEVLSAAQLSARSYRNPDFETEPVDMSFDHEVGTFEVQDLVVEGSFGEKGGSVEEISVSGSLDMRQIPALDPRVGAAEACQDIIAVGGECVPCRDGEPVCVLFRYNGLRGVPVPEPAFAGSLLIGGATLFAITRRRRKAMSRSCLTKGTRS